MDVRGGSVLLLTRILQGLYRCGLASIYRYYPSSRGISGCSVCVFQASIGAVSVYCERLSVSAVEYLLPLSVCFMFFSE